MMNTSTATPFQPDLFSQVAAAYAENGRLSNAALYRIVAGAAGIDDGDLDRRVPIGKTGSLRSPIKRKIRWAQQTLKHLGVIERVDGERGLWGLSEQTGELQRALEETKLVAFSTELGLAVWGRAKSVFDGISEPLHLIFTSPPYPLRRARAYGNVEGEYVDFMCSALEPLVKNMVAGASLVLQISPDIFEEKSPARSLYVERLVLAMHDRLGLSLMDRIPWVNYSKPPSPTHWACVNRVQLSAAYELALWFTNDPHRVRSDNRRVLQEHSQRHQQLMAMGGEGRSAVYGDGAYRIRPDSFAGVTKGKIPRNVIERGHVCKDTMEYRKKAKALGLPLHGAMHPTDLPDFFIRLLTQVGEVVADPFGGIGRTGLAAERLMRRWIVSEWMAQYLRGGAELFRGSKGFGMHPLFSSM